MGYDLWWGHWWAMGLGWLVLALLIGGAVWIGVRGGRGGSDASAEEILRRRYAAGEISEQEYRERLVVLQGRAP